MPTAKKSRSLTLPIQILYFLILLYGLSLAISTAATNGLLLVIVVYSFYLIYQGKLKDWRAYPALWLPLLLWVYLGLSSLYGQADTDVAMSVWLKYRELLTIPLFFVIFRTTRLQKLGLDVFIISLLITVSLGYWVEYMGLPSKQIGDNAIFKNYITESILISFAAYICAYRVWQAHRPLWRLAYALLSVLMIYHVLVHLQSRTGYLVLFALLLLLLFQHYRWRGLWLASLFGLFAVISLYVNVALFQERVDSTLYSQPDQQLNAPLNSTQIRQQFYQHSLTLIKQHPWLGTGIGSFETVFKQQSGLTASHPHNEYYLLTIQAGLPALMWWLLCLFWFLYQVNPRKTQSVWHYLQALLLLMIVSCLFNSFLLDFTEAHIFAYLIGLFGSYLYAPRSQT